MKRLSHIGAVLAFVFALLVGATGGASAPGDPAHHHATHSTPGHSVPSQDGSPKAALTVAVPCCAAAEIPAQHDVVVTVRLVSISWDPRPEFLLDARAIAPETPPPKNDL